MASTDVLNGTLQNIQTKIVDGVFSSNVLLQEFMRNTTPFTGKTENITLKYQKTGTGWAFGHFDKFLTNGKNTTVQMVHGPKFVYQSITLSEIDIGYSDLPKNVINLVVKSTEEATQELADNLGTMIYGNGTGSGGLDLDGLESAIKTSGSYGGLDYSTYTMLQSPVDSSTNLAGLTLAKIDALFTAASSGNVRPNLLVTTKEIWDKIATLIPVTQIQNAVQSGAFSLFGKQSEGLSVNAGASNLNYRGMTIIADEKCPSGKAYILNVPTWKLYTFKMGTPSTAVVKYSPIMVESSLFTGQYDQNVEKKFSGFMITNFMRPEDQAAVTAQIIFGGNLICKDPRRNAKFTNLV